MTFTIVRTKPLATPLDATATTLRGVIELENST
jgi:hypothetical protein